MDKSYYTNFTKDHSIKVHTQEAQNVRQLKSPLVKVPRNVNIVKQDLPHKKQFLKILWSED